MSPHLRSNTSPEPSPTASARPAIGPLFACHPDEGCHKPRGTGSSMAFVAQDYNGSGGHGALVRGFSLNSQRSLMITRFTDLLEEGTRSSCSASHKVRVGVEVLSCRNRVNCKHYPSRLWLYPFGVMCLPISGPKHFGSTARSSGEEGR